MELKGKKLLVTGGAGFIGSHVVDRLVAEGATVTVLDNFSGGKEDFLAQSRKRIALVKGDCGDRATLDKIMPGMDGVWHLAANPDVRSGESDPFAHYDQNVRVTYEVLEAMRRHQVKHLAFTSTSTVYGRASVIPTPESYGPLYPISVYGACKLACEALIASYAGTFGINALLFRFANVVGPRSTHGVIIDFVRKLRADPKKLQILGDGKQTKSYVSVADTVDGMVHATRFAPVGKTGSEGTCLAFNIGSTDAIDVVQLADIVAGELKLKPTYAFTAGASDGGGWKGDVKRMGLDIAALGKLGPGWKPKHGSAEAVRVAARSLL